MRRRLAMIACLCLAGPARAHWGGGGPAVLDPTDSTRVLVTWAAAGPWEAWQLRDRFDDDGDGALSAPERTALVRFCAGRAAGPLASAGRLVALAGLDEPTTSTAPLAVTISLPVRLREHP